LQLELEMAHALLFRNGGRKEALGNFQFSEMKCAWAHFIT